MFRMWVRDRMQVSAHRNARRIASLNLAVKPPGLILQGFRNAEKPVSELRAMRRDSEIRYFRNLP